MAKITFIGAGSLGFTRGLVRDLLTFPLLKDATLALMDIDAERLEFAQKAVQKIVNEAYTNPETVLKAPHNTSVSRLNEAKASHPGTMALSWRMLLKKNTQKS